MADNSPAREEEGEPRRPAPRGKIHIRLRFPADRDIDDFLSQQPQGAVSDYVRAAVREKMAGGAVARVEQKVDQVIRLLQTGTVIKAAVEAAQERVKVDLGLIDQFVGTAKPKRKKKKGRK